MRDPWIAAETVRSEQLAQRRLAFCSSAHGLIYELIKKIVLNCLKR